MPPVSVNAPQSQKRLGGVCDTLKVTVKTAVVLEYLAKQEESVVIPTTVTLLAKSKWPTPILN